MGIIYYSINITNLIKIKHMNLSNLNNIMSGSISTFILPLLTSFMSLVAFIYMYLAAYGIDGKVLYSFEVNEFFAWLLPFLKNFDNIILYFIILNFILFLFLIYSYTSLSYKKAYRDYFIIRLHSAITKFLITPFFGVGGGFIWTKLNILEATCRDSISLTPFISLRRHWSKAEIGNYARDYLISLGLDVSTIEKHMGYVNLGEVIVSKHGATTMADAISACKRYLVFLKAERDKKEKLALLMDTADLSLSNLTLKLTYVLQWALDHPYITLISFASGIMCIAYWFGVFNNIVQNIDIIRSELGSSRDAMIDSNNRVDIIANGLRELNGTVQKIDIRDIDSTRGLTDAVDYLKSALDGASPVIVAHSEDIEKLKNVIGDLSHNVTCLSSKIDIIQKYIDTLSPTFALLKDEKFIGTLNNLTKPEYAAAIAALGRQTLNNL
jgi:hypothetical protein